MKRLERDRNDRKISGLCAGIANYFTIDPSVVRLLMVAVTLATAIAPGIIFYLIASIIIPQEGSTDAKA